MKNNESIYMQALEQIGSKFTNTTGQSISFIDRDGEWKGQLNLQSFTGFCRRVISSEKGRPLCSKCNNAFEKTKGGCIDISKCHMGISVVSVPVQSENNHLLLSYGQFLQEETRDDFFATLAENSRKLGIDCEELRALAADLKVFSKSELDDRIELLRVFSNYVSITENELKAQDQYYRECQKKLEIENKLSAMELESLKTQINQAFITEALTAATDLAYKEHAKQTADLLHDLLQLLVKRNAIQDFGANPQEDIVFANEYKRLKTIITQIRGDMPAVQETDDSVTEDKNKTVLKASAILRARYAQQVSLESVAKELFISPIYLSRIFKEKTGKNFKEYLIEMRMREAQKLLAQGKATVNEIAAAVGYDDASYFSKAYKKQFGYTPKSQRSERAKKAEKGKIIAKK